jgi:hypothetical protein
MTVEVRNGYWEYRTTYRDIIRIEEKRHSFILYMKNGFYKEFDNGIYTYHEVD